MRFARRFQDQMSAHGNRNPSPHVSVSQFPLVHPICVRLRDEVFPIEGREMHFRIVVPLVLVSALWVAPVWGQGKVPQRAWIPGDPAVECVGVEVPSLCADLLKMQDQDQMVRRKLIVGADNSSVDAEMNKVDGENQRRLEEIVAKLGWPSDKQVGRRASGAAWTIVQHASLSFQQRLLPVLQRAADNGQMDRGLLAFTVDRVRLGEGKPQLYGTQFSESNGRLVPRPIEDEAHVDERRKEVGLQPIAEYAKLINDYYRTLPRNTPPSRESQHQ